MSTLSLNLLVSVHSTNRNINQRPIERQQVVLHISHSAQGPIIHLVSCDSSQSLLRTIVVGRFQFRQETFTIDTPDGQVQLTIHNANADQVSRIRRELDSRQARSPGPSVAPISAPITPIGQPTRNPNYPGNPPPYATPSTAPLPPYAMSSNPLNARNRSSSPTFIPNKPYPPVQPYGYPQGNQFNSPPPVHIQQQTNQHAVPMQQRFNPLSLCTLPPYVTQNVAPARLMCDVSKVNENIERLSQVLTQIQQQNNLPFFEEKFKEKPPFYPKSPPTPSASYPVSQSRPPQQPSYPAAQAQPVHPSFSAQPGVYPQPYQNQAPYSQPFPGQPAYSQPTPPARGGMSQQAYYRDLFSRELRNKSKIDSACGAMQQMLSMGFNEQASIRAIVEADGDQSRAIDIYLEQTS